MTYRYDGRVVVITGAGRGLGRAHALLFASLGASVVVNDVGGSKEGVGADSGPANDVVAEIRSTGGTAVADIHSIATEDGCRELVATAIREFGRIDVLVNNAGISRWASFPEADAENLERTLDVHVRGSWHATRAAWGHFVEQGYGRVILTNSTGMFGMPDNLAYSTAKGAILGMMRSLSLAGAPHGITVNCISPNASSRPSETSAPVTFSMNQSEKRADGMRAELVSPMVAYLAHESIDITGQIYMAGGSRFSRMFIGATDGYLHDGPEDPTVDDVAHHLAQIDDLSDYYTPASATEWGKRYLGHLFP